MIKEIKQLEESLLETEDPFFFFGLHSVCVPELIHSVAIVLQPTSTKSKLPSKEY